MCTLKQEIGLITFIFFTYGAQSFFSFKSLPILTQCCSFDTPMMHSEKEHLLSVAVMRPYILNKWVFILNVQAPSIVLIKHLNLLPSQGQKELI